MTAEIILWADAHSFDPWTPVDDLVVTPPRILSIGLVTKETPEAVALSCGYDISSENVCATLIIPKSLILRRELIADPAGLGEWTK